MRGRWSIPVVAAASLAALAPGAAAAPGAQDPSFGSNGRVLTRVSTQGSGVAVAGIALQADGRIVAAGSANGRVALARYLVDGRLDPTFGDGGTVRMRIGSSSGLAAVALAPNGAIVVAGLRYPQPDDGEPDMLLARIRPDGSLDASFGHGGIVVTDAGGDSDEADGVAVASDGTIAVAGRSVAANGDVRRVVALYGPDGTLDRAFGVRPGPVGSLANAVAFDASGRVLAAGLAGGQASVVRYLRSGALDATFAGGDGSQGFAYGAGGSSVASSLAVAADGSIAVAGAQGVGERDDTVMGVARLRPDGGLDASFAGDGATQVPCGRGSCEADGVVVDQAGNVAVAGLIDAAGSDPPSFGLARLTPAGALDAGFGRHGRVVTWFTFSPLESQAHALALDANGRLVAAGDALTARHGYAFALARYLSS